MEVLLVGLGAQLLGGLAALGASRAPRCATGFGVGGAVIGCLLGLIPTFRVLLGGPPESLCFAWDEAHGPFRVGLDGLSAFFLVPVLGLAVLAAVYGADYLLAYRRQKPLGGAWFFFNLFVAGMVGVVIARTVLLFLVAWEVMSLSAYCLVTFEHEKEETRRAGWVYLVATHLGVAFLFAAFLLLGRHAGSLDFEDFRRAPALAAGGSGLVFALALVGFGAKAGFVPLHVWLPEAHPAAPSHVSALMSGVMIKMGIYGLLRVVTFLGQPAVWWGPTLAVIGLSTALVGISLALYQRDLKRALAYSSIENMGLITLALGAGFWGLASGHPAVAALGFAGALLHVWNHALMKGLMFLAAGSVMHGTGSRDLERLGGLMKRMPWTGTLMVIGAVALAALPPLNGFTSKWLMYLALAEGGVAESAAGLPALLAVGLLALVGGLGSVCFVRLCGIALLGSPRSEAASHAHESSPWLLGPMGVLAALCVTAGLLPHLVAHGLTGALATFLGGTTGERPAAAAVAAIPLSTLGLFDAACWGVVAVAAASLLVLARKGGTETGATWGCGYARPTTRMQYTAGSFSELLAEHLLPRFLRPRTFRKSPTGLFPTSARFASDCPDPLTRTVYDPFFSRWAERFMRLRVLQQGMIQVYLVYILLAVVLALAWAPLWAWVTA